MLPPTLVRRFALVPLVVVIAACLVALTPLVALASWASALVRRWTGHGHRSRPLRVAWLALTWSVGEMAVLTVLLCLWIVSGFGGRLDTEPYRARHYAVMGRFLNQIYRAAERACGLRVKVAGPPDEALADDRPVIVLSRHAGPGDSLLVVHHLLTVCGRRPRVVMKATLQLDPTLDVVANRVPNAFLHRRSPAPRRRAAPAPAPPAAAGPRPTRSGRSGGWRPASAGATRCCCSPRAGTGRRSAGVGASRVCGGEAMPIWPSGRRRCPTCSRRGPAGPSPPSTPARRRT